MPAATDLRARGLRPGDAPTVLALLERDPIQNVLLQHVVSAGVLGRVPGFIGCFDDRGCEGVLMVGPLGGTALALRSPEAAQVLATFAGEHRLQIRHISGAEEPTIQFWATYASFAPGLLWERRERLYVARSVREASPARVPGAVLRPAREYELEQVVLNSAEQHHADLKEDRLAADPEGFRLRHQRDVRDGHWWVLERGGTILFQVHVGPRNRAVVQIGGVFTPPELRGRGYATIALRELLARLLLTRAAVSLLCDEANFAARRVYERVGFELVSFNHSYLLPAPRAEPLASYL